MNTQNFDPQTFTQISTPDGGRVVVAPSGDVITFNRFGRRIGSDWVSDVIDFIVSFVSSHPGAIASQQA